VSSYSKQNIVFFVCLYVRLSGYRDICRVFTFLLTPWSRVLLEKLIVLNLLKKSSAFYGTRRFICGFGNSPLLVPILKQISPREPHLPYTVVFLEDPF